MLRRLTIDDLPSFRELRTTAGRLHPDAFHSPDEQGSPEKRDESYRRWLSGYVFGAFEKESLIGSIGFYIESDQRTQHIGHIFSVFLIPEYRGRGLGDALMKTALSVADPLVEQLLLNVRTSAKPAIRTYEKHGFHICGTIPHAFKLGDAYVDEHIMIKNLR